MIGWNPCNVFIENWIDKNELNRIESNLLSTFIRTKDSLSLSTSLAYLWGDSMRCLMFPSWSDKSTSTVGKRNQRKRDYDGSKLKVNWMWNRERASECAKKLHGAGKMHSSFITGGKMWWIFF